MAVVKGVRVKVRISALESEIRLKGGRQNRPGREGAQSKIVTDAPVMELDLLEYEQRKSADDGTKDVYSIVKSVVIP